jgi:hypothetical protein
MLSENEGFRCQVSGFSTAAGLKSGQSNRKRNQGIRNPKSQAPPDLKIGSNKSQISIFNDRNRFGI